MSETVKSTNLIHDVPDDLMIVIFSFLEWIDGIQNLHIMSKRIIRIMRKSDFYMDVAFYKVQELQNFRDYYPKVTSLKIRGSKWTDDHFIHLRGVKDLDMATCTTIGDGAFVHLSGIHKLDMSRCNQTTITSAAFVHLKDIKTLIMWFCNQLTISDVAFSNLTKIHTLDISYCVQETITNDSFQYFRGIHTLKMHRCNQITDDAFRYLSGINTLYIGNNKKLTSAIFQYLRCIQKLYVLGCNNDVQTNAYLHFSSSLCDN